MTTLTVLALDPGGTSGWAAYRATHIQALFRVGDDRYEQWHNETVDEYYDEEWNRGHLGPEDHSLDLEALLEIMRTDEYVVVCERYVPRPDNKGKIDIAEKYVGQVELFCKREDIKLVLQMPAQGKGFVKDITIKKLGLWFPGWRHAMDATRHLLFYLVTNTSKKEELLEKGWKF